MTVVRLSPATISKLGLEPGDVIVVRVTDEYRRLTTEQAASIVESVRTACGDHQVIVLPYGLEIEKLELEARA